MKDQLDVTCYFISLIMRSTRTPPNTSRNKSSNTQRTENKTTDVVIHQHSRKLLKMDILMSETCWVHNKCNKIASDIKLVFHSSTIAMMHGPINIRLQHLISWKSVSVELLILGQILKKMPRIYIHRLCSYKRCHWELWLKLNCFWTAMKLILCLH